MPKHPVRIEAHDLREHVTGMDVLPARGPTAVRLTLQVLAHEYLLSTIFLKLSNLRDDRSHHNGFKAGYNWGLHEALRLLGLPAGFLDTLYTEADGWAEAHCPAILDGSNACQAGCHACSWIKLPCYCDAPRGHTLTCPAAYNLCLCNEPASPKARLDEHAAWCPRCEAARCEAAHD